MKKRFSVLIIAIIFLNACSPSFSSRVSNNDTDKMPTAIQLDDGTGGISGIYKIPEKWGEENIYAYAAPFVGDPNSDGIFIYGGGFSFFGEISTNGYFQIANLEPGVYILLIGPDIDHVTAYQDNGSANKIYVTANQYTDIGTISTTP